MLHSYKKIYLAIIAVLCFSVSYGQQSSEKRKEMLREVLKEKTHLPPGSASLSAHSSARTTNYDERITTTGTDEDEGEISIIYDPTDSSKLLLSFMQLNETSGQLNFPLYYSSDAGATWTLSSFSASSILTTDFPGQFEVGGGDPAFAWDKTGRVYFSWIFLSQNTSDSSFFTLNWAYSDDNGHTWNVKPNHFIGQGALNPGGGIYPYKDGITDREWLAVDNSAGPHHGNVYCSFVCFPSDSTASTFEGIKTLIAGADSFTNMVAAFTGSTQFGNVEVTNTGVLHMSFADLDSIQIRHTASTDGGLSFTPSELISPATNIFPHGVFTVHNRENAAVNISADGPLGTGSNIHAVWSDFPDPGGMVYSYYSHSADGGHTWSLPDTLNNFFGGNLTFMPTVSCFGNFVAISLTVIDAFDSATYYQLPSFDNGTTFTPPVLISSAPTSYLSYSAASPASPLFFGDYNRSVRTQCQAYAAWCDGRNGLGPKVYFSRTDYCQPLIFRQVSAITSGIQVVSLYPDPASTFVTVSINTAANSLITLSLSDIDGKLVLKQSEQITSGTNQVKLHLKNIQPGIYLLTINNPEGLIATRQLLVQ